jgi:hypothetical protein
MRHRLSINERLELAGQLALRSRIFYDLWLYFKGKHPPAIFDVMQDFSQFFRFEIEAQFSAFVVHIAALFDGRSDTINLRSLAREMKMAKLTSTKAATEVDALLTQAAPLATKVTILRSHLFAHRSAALSYADAFKKAAVTSNQLRDLTVIALKIANRLLMARGLRDHIFNPRPGDHAAAMLKVLMQKNPDSKRSA